MKHGSTQALARPSGLLWTGPLLVICVTFTTGNKRTRQLPFPHANHATHLSSSSIYMVNQV